MALAPSLPSLGFRAQARPFTLKPVHLHAAFIACWEAQSQVATVVWVALVALGSVWFALPIMLGWSLIATVAYSYARRRGYPDILEQEWRPLSGSSHSHRVLKWAGEAIKLWCAGLQAFAFSRATLATIRRPCRGIHSLCKALLLVIGLTLFGVSTAEHLLRNAGYRGGLLLRLSLLGPFFNVPYRTLLSAALAHAVMSMIRLVC